MAIRRFNGNEVGNVAAGIEFYGNNYSSGCNSKGESFRNDSTIYFDSREEIKWFAEFLQASPENAPYFENRSDSSFGRYTWWLGKGINKADAIAFDKFCKDRGYNLVWTNQNPNDC